MTAIIAFTAGPEAYLLADSAYIDTATGKLDRLAGKIAALPSLSAVIAGCGMGGVAELIQRLDDADAPLTQERFLHALPSLLALVSADVTKATGVANPSLHWFLATYDREARRPRNLYIGTDDTMGLCVEPYRIAEVGKGFVMPKPDRPAYCDDLNDAMGLMQAQRRVRFANAGGAIGVGGECHAYRIGAAGIWGRVVMRFPDTLGTLLDPDAIAERVEGPWHPLGVAA